MSFADLRGTIGSFEAFLHSKPRRYGFAVLSIAIATGLRYVLGIYLGFQSPFFLYPPTLIAIAVLAGFWPGFFATLIGAVAGGYLFLEPRNSFAVRNRADILGPLIFTLYGIATCALGEVLRRHAKRLEEFERAMEGLDEMIVVVSRDYRFLIANRAFLKYRGVKKEDVVGQPVQAGMNTGVFESVVKEKLDECFAGHIVTFQLRYNYPIHGERDLVLTYYPLNGLNGVDRAVCVMRDVTDQQKAEGALRESEEMLRIAQQAARIGTFDANHVTGKVRWSPEMYALYGLSREDFDGTNEGFLRMVHPDDLARVKELMARGDETGGAEGEWRVMRPDGSVCWIASRWKVYKNDCGEPARAIGIDMDITARKEAQEALGLSEQRYQRLFEKSVAGVGILRWDGTIVDCNDSWARIYGYEHAAEMIGTQITPHYPRAAERLDFLGALREKGFVRNREMEMCRRDGTPVWVLITSVLIENGGGDPQIQSTIVDINEKKRGEVELRRREEDYRRFVTQSSEGIYCEEMAEPIPLDLPVDEMILRMRHDAHITECNDALAKMYGFEKAEALIGKHLAEMLVPDDPKNLELMREYVRSGFRVLDRKSHETDKHGNPKVFCNSMTGIVENGKLVRTWGIQRDVTEWVKLGEERNKAEDALRKSEERFRVALKDSPIGVFTQDRDLRFTWIYNSRFSPEQVLGKTDEEVLGDDGRRLKELKLRVLTTGLKAREEIVIPHDGETWAYDVSVEPLFDGEGKIVGITGASVDIARLRELTSRLEEQRDRLAQQKSYLESEIQTELGFEQIVGQSSALREVLKKARIVAPTDSTVLLLGETGTGKELVARSVHALSVRRDKTFVKLNCAAVPAGLLESELFGHEKGAFTSAVSQKIGRIELADKGTLFLDEIGELPLELQPKLLRVLQDREFERLGGVRTLKVDVRIIAATNRDLRQDIADRVFREDLYYRLNVFPIELPPLRERRDDIPMLVHYFVEKCSARMGKPIDRIPEETLDRLRNWNWPGNVRELENMIERMVILTKGSVLAPPPVELESPQIVVADDLEEMERDHIIRALQEANGVLSGVDGAAVRLGLKRTTLQSMLKRFGIDAQDFRRSNGTNGRA
jgi:PAS domain S-box-containing protein